jgi:flagellar basal body-associated protein FliL
MTAITILVLVLIAVLATAMMGLAVYLGRADRERGDG